MSLKIERKHYSLREILTSSSPVVSVLEPRFDRAQVDGILDDHRVERERVQIDWREERFRDRQLHDSRHPAADAVAGDVAAPWWPLRRLRSVHESLELVRCDRHALSVVTR